MAEAFTGRVARVMKCFIALILVCGLCGCQFLGTIANGAHKAYTFLADDRSWSDDVTDIRINLEIRDGLAREKGSLFFDIEVSVFEGEVLLNGAIPDVELIQKIMSVVWSVDGVRKVYNYIRVAEPLTVEEVAAEAGIAAQIRTELGMTAGIESSNYKLILENGVVYLMGIRSSRAEYEAAVAVIKNAMGVDRIICLMREPIES